MYYDIIDKNGDQMPRHYSGRPRTYEEVMKMLERLNKNGEYAPYIKVEVPWAMKPLGTWEQIKEENIHTQEIATYE